MVSFEFACRDFRKLAADEKMCLDVCKYRLSQFNIRHKIDFEALTEDQLPNFIRNENEGEDDGEEAEENLENGDERIE